MFARAGLLSLAAVLLMAAGAAEGQVVVRKGIPGAVRRVPPGGGRGGRLESLERLTPEQQERYLSSLPAERRAEARRRLEKWRQMTPEERNAARQTLGEFRDLSPERQRRIRILYGEFASMPADRQPGLRAELSELRKLNPGERRARAQSKEFRRRYSVEERRLLLGLAAALPGQVEEAVVEEKPADEPAETPKPERDNGRE